MTPRQVALVQETWNLAAQLGERAAELLYERLFTLDPTLRRLFEGDMKAQGRKLLSMMGFAVGSLSRFDSIVPAVQALGRRHAGYGVEKRHYAVVEEALMWTLGQGLGAKFTPEVEKAWRTAYGALASTMQHAAQEQTSHAS